jgi:bla regulator protein blaR1
MLSRRPKLHHRLLLALLAFATAQIAHAQILHPNTPLPSFEVATIKPWQPPPPPPPSPDGSPRTPAKIAPGNGGGQTTDRVHSILPIQLLIAFAYNIPFGSERLRVLGGPDWLASEQYELQAKIDESSYAAIQKLPPAQQREQVDLMEQSLLADRFKLKVHFETREMPGFTLTVAKGGPKLAPAREGESQRISLRGNQMTATATTLDQWIQSPFLGGRTVLNQTALPGTYDFTLTWSDQLAASPTPDTTDAPSLFTAVQEQLGLKLTPTKVPVEVIVIDHIERPSPN